MDAFESVIAMLLRRKGYWTSSSVKVDLTKEEKRRIGKHTTPRWELDIVAYKGSTNEILAVECKSYLDSRGVDFRNGVFDIPSRYKLFTEPTLREVVLGRLSQQLQSSGACAANPTIRLCLATGRVATKSDHDGMRAHFHANDWALFDAEWVRTQLSTVAEAGYENDVAFVVAKILLKNAGRPKPKS